MNHATATANSSLYQCDACDDVVSRILRFDGEDMCHACGYEHEIMRRPIACDGCGCVPAVLFADDSLMVCDGCMD